MTGLQVAAGCDVGTFSLDVEMTARDGEVVAVIGPNGSGKSTLLRAVAGLQPLSRGTIRLGDRTLDDAGAGVFVPARERRVGMVFSDVRLFPSMTALDNVAFGLRARGVANRAARAAAAQWLERLGIGDLGRRRREQLSGGQAQRVAIARALACEPDVLLLDEPLAALDVATRSEVQTALSAHVASFGGPTLLVTHDPLEAVLLASRIVVLERGRVVQAGTPVEVTNRPATPYVARVVGVNLWSGRSDGPAVVLDDGGVLVVADAPPGRVLVSAAPSSFTLHAAAPGGSSARNGWDARVESLAVVGDAASGLVRARLTGPPSVAVDLTPAAVAELDLAPGRRVWVTAKATALSAYPAPDEIPTRGVGPLP